MSRTWLAVLTALFFVIVSLVLVAVRRSLLGEEIDGPLGQSAWRVSVVATGKTTGKNPQVRLALPPDFRRQHILDEQFQSRQFLHRLVRQEGVFREAVWTPRALTAPSFRLVYSFRCLLEVRQPSPSMKQTTLRLDDSPREGQWLRASERVETEDRQIVEHARTLSENRTVPLDQVQGFLDYVSELHSDPPFDVLTARDCLMLGAGDSGGKCRLLVALCRSRGIPARVLSGLILGADQGDLHLHYWVEAWVNEHWLPLCPTHRHLGTRHFPRNYLVLHIGDEPLFQTRGAQIQYRFLVEKSSQVANGADSHTESAAREWFRKASFFTLSPSEQRVVGFLLLLPLAALIVSFFRTVVGILTFGTFGPALYGLIFLDPRSLVWGLLLLVTIILAAWGVRHVLEYYRLLQIPRISILLTFVVVLLIVVIVVASRFGLPVTQYISLFPLIILTHFVERFWTVEVEDSPSAAFKMLLGTILVVVVVSLGLQPQFVRDVMFRYPELLGIVIALQLLLGRYTGYRLVELYRFRDLLEEEQLSRRTA